MWPSATRFRCSHKEMGAFHYSTVPAPWHPYQRGEIADVSAFDVAKLTVFGASLFWRFSVSRDYAAHLGRYDLGPYEPPLRKFLLGEMGFPEGTRLIFSLMDYSTMTIARVDRSFGFAPCPKNSGFRSHRFTILGVDMLLFVGGRIPSSSLEVCLARTGRVIVRPSDFYARQFGRALETSKPKGKLARMPTS